MSRYWHSGHTIVVATIGVCILIFILMVFDLRFP